MSEKTNIGWTDVTASPWFICTEVDECCANCYSREMTKTKFAKMLREAFQRAGFENWETLPLWGDKAPRVLSKGFRENVLKYNRQAAIKGAPLRLFTSLMDWLDLMPAGCCDQYGHRMTRLEFVADYLHLIFETPNLDHLTLTKRPENWKATLEAVEKHYALAPSVNDSFCAWLRNWLEGQPPENVWFGFTAGTQKSWNERSVIALGIPARWRWCSAEPLLEPIGMDLGTINYDWMCHGEWAKQPAIHWVVPGGESGPKRRDCGVEAIVDLAEQCQHSGTPCFVKQDCHLKPGQQGRIPADVWALKQFPSSRVIRATRAASPAPNPTGKELKCT